MTPSAGDLKRVLVTKIKEGNKTAYGKNELILFIEETYSNFIELWIEQIKRRDET
jgi:transcriptional regulator